MRTRSLLLLATFAVLAAACATSNGPVAPPTTGAETPIAAPNASATGEDPGAAAPGGGNGALHDLSGIDATELAEVVEPVPEVSDEQPRPLGDPLTMQQEALELCQEAAQLLDAGAMDDAIAALDRAYELMLALPANGDAEFLQAKEDIRRLVADLILRTYDLQRAAAAPPTASWDLAIEMVSNEHVQREIRSFTGPERAEFLEAYRRSGLYRPMIVAKLQEAALPSQLSWMPMVESWFKVRALSRASALGMWQFINSTGLRYGLKRDAWVDERMDPEKSTDAAIAYLSELHAMFGDWPKALAGYNCGEARVMRLQGRSPSEYRDFWDIYMQLPSETRRYVPRFLAALAIVEDPERYGMTLPEPLPPLTGWTTIRTERAIRIADLERSLGLETGALAALNPELRKGATPARPYDLKVPAPAAEQATTTIAELPQYSPPQPEYSTHRVRSGDTLSSIARRYGSSVEAIMRANNLRSAHRIKPGQRLEIPVRGGSAPPPAAAFNPGEGTHTVRAGESLYSIASHYRTTVARLKADNGLTSDIITPGLKLQVRPSSRPDPRRYQVRSGDTPAAIATSHGVNLAALLGANGLTRRSTIYPGQWLVIP